jgi:hypothetical protein
VAAHFPSLLRSRPAILELRRVTCALVDFIHDARLSALVSVRRISVPDSSGARPADEAGGKPWRRPPNVLAPSSGQSADITAATKVRPFLKSHRRGSQDGRRRGVRDVSRTSRALLRPALS